jgi:small redox-active disulfide protein 2
MKIQVLGSGCPSCHKLFETTKQAVKDLNIKEEVEYITDIQKILELGVMESPVLAIDGKPVLAGSVPSVESVKDIIKQTISKETTSGCDCGGNCR